MSELQEIPDRPLRSGYTTGACATACSKAALLSLLSQMKVDEVEIVLPAGEKASFSVIDCSFTTTHCTCTTRKDAGDDPDVTHKAVIGARVSLNDHGTVVFLQGEGVGTVTLPGLEIPVGEPAINPVPRKMMESACRKVLSDHHLAHKGVDIIVFVEDGANIAKRTLNGRLGILGGISILGTSGIVTPFSAASYIASIRQGIDVAIANGAGELVLNSGARSEKFLKALFPQTPEYAFIHYGNWVGETYHKIAESSLKKVNMGIMLGKAVKLAEGRSDTHSGKNSWDKEFVYQLAKKAGHPEHIAGEILKMNMAGRLTELFSFTSTEKFYQVLLEQCFNYCMSLAPKIDLNLFLIDKEGSYIKFLK